MQPAMEESGMEIERSSGKFSKQSSMSSKMSVEDQHFAACAEEMHSLRISNHPIAQKSSNVSSVVSKNSVRSEASLLDVPKGHPLEQKFSIQSNASDKMRKQLESADLFDKITRETEQTKEFTDPYRMSYGDKVLTRISTETNSTNHSDEVHPPSVRLSQEAPRLSLMEMVVEDPQEDALVLSPVLPELKGHSMKATTILKSTAAQSVEGSEVGCKCHKSKCIMKYCDCFSRQRLCTDKCQCHPCKNNEHSKETLERAKTSALEKDPEAFSSKLELIGKGDDAPRLAVKRGCNCKKTLCFKKYCECFDAGVKCTPLCKCCDCLNGGENAFKE